MERDDSVPMGYYRVLREVRERLTRDAIICSEGANTMDIGRSSLPNELPRHRLDAGTFGTMGVGLGFAIAAAAVRPDKKVVAVGTIEELLALDHPWIQEYFNGPRGRAAAAGLKGH